MDILGIRTRVCTAEDLIIHKAISERSKDWGDIEGILMRQRGKLDVKYIRHWLSQFAEALENPELLARFNHLYETI
jgi:predicted nucleotidyltransferase